MDNEILTDRTACGASDISGVKNAEPSHPEGEATAVFQVADETENTEACIENPTAGELEIGNGTSENEGLAEENALEAEFDALVKGRFSEVYKRRTESIIRRRLRSVKMHAERKNDSEIKVAGEVKPATEAEAEAMQVSDSVKSNGAPARLEAVRRQNQARPIENGLSGSSGIVTRINVSALDSEGVLSIIRRVGSGEKISFK